MEVVLLTSGYTYIWKLQQLDNELEKRINIIKIDEFCQQNFCNNGLKHANFLQLLYLALME